MIFDIATRITKILNVIKFIITTLIIMTLSIVTLIIKMLSIGTFSISTQHCDIQKLHLT
jgi:hypothetical protein